MTEIFAKTAYLENGFFNNVQISIDEMGWITDVKTDAELGENDIITGILMPGMTNVHSHAFQRAMAGLTEKPTSGKDSFWTWRDLMYRFLDKLGPDEMNVIASQAYMEMLKAGYTSVGEFHYVHHASDGELYEEMATLSHAVCWAALQTGISMTYLPVYYEFGGFGQQPVESHQQRFSNDFEQLLSIRSDVSSTYTNEERVNIGFAYHSLRAIDPARLRDAPHGPIHIHISEQQKEVDDCLKAHQKRPVEYLFDHADVDRNWTLVHATHVSEQEIKLIAQSGAIAGLCPTTEANLGDGIFPLVDYVSRSGKFAIGSDSHISIQPVEELRWLEYGQRLTYQARSLLGEKTGQSTGEFLYNQAVENGALSLGQITGKIAKGYRADMIVLDHGHALLAGKKDHEILDTWVFAGNKNLVTDVMVHGKWQVKSGRHLQEDVITTAYVQLMKELMA